MRSPARKLVLVSVVALVPSACSGDDRGVAGGSTTESVSSLATSDPDPDAPTGTSETTAPTSGPSTTEATDATSTTSEDSSTTDAVDCRVDGDEVAACTSRTTWTYGDRASTLMRPGWACNECHLASGGAPAFAIAGTVYPTLHEPDDCYGASGAMDSVFVRIIGSDDAVLDLPVGTSGNFFASGSAGIVFPVRAEILFDGKIRSMCGAQTNGDCNTCHTQEGTSGAPGRIRLP